MPYPDYPQRKAYADYKKRVGKHETIRPTRGKRNLGRHAPAWEADQEKVAEFTRQYEARYGKSPEWYFTNDGFKPAYWKSAYTKGRPASKPSERAGIRAAILRAIETGKSDEID
jgi:hypothetical protein